MVKSGPENAEPLFMKTVILFTIFFALFSGAAEILEVRNQIPMTNDAPRIKDYYLSTDGSNLKKDLVVKIVRKISVSQGKKNVGEVTVEIGQLRILAVVDKIAIAREYKLFSNDQTPITESVGFMTGDQVEMANSFIDNSKRKPSGDESAVLATPAASEPSADSEKIEIKVFPDKI